MGCHVGSGLEETRRRCCGLSRWGKWVDISRDILESETPKVEQRSLKKEARREAGMYNSIYVKFDARQNQSMRLILVSCDC